MSPYRFARECGRRSVESVTRTCLAIARRGHVVVSHRATEFAWPAEKA